MGDFTTSHIPERAYTDEELSRLQVYYQDVVIGHEKCEGTGLYPGDGQLVYCECLLIYNYIKELVYMRLPQRYWFVGIGDYAELTMDGGVIFKGDSLAGKTTAIARLGKIALISNRLIVIYCDVNELVSWGFEMSAGKKTEPGIHSDRLNLAHIILVDDIDSLVIYNKFSNILEMFESRIKILSNSGKRIVMSYTDSKKIKSPYVKALVLSFNNVITCEKSPKFVKEKNQNFFQVSFIKEARKFSEKI